MLPSRPLHLVDSTLREGEQFARAAFTSDQRVALALALDAFGVDVIELTSPIASPRAARDFERVVALGLRGEVAAHVRCREDDALAALDRGADALHLYLGTSSPLRVHSHGRDLDGVLAAARHVIPRLRERASTLRFSCEDAFRTPTRDILRVVPGGSTDIEASIAWVWRTRSAPRPTRTRWGHDRSSSCARRSSATSSSTATTTPAVPWPTPGRPIKRGRDARRRRPCPGHWRAQRHRLAVRARGRAGGYMTRPEPSSSGYDLDGAGRPSSAYVADAIGIDVPFNACISSPTAFSAQGRACTPRRC